ncbi:LOW QUALITY PROTEIN: potassium voltage-gated channel subfamily E regulatory beta subunit 5 [Molossus molossus]|nr:LOW QUALITY PROTEIN: potassium voltage-gated channel subfamily E regulatory beta subunit 5 [Molossus molossus]
MTQESFFQIFCIECCCLSCKDSETTNKGFKQGFLQSVKFEEDKRQRVLVSSVLEPRCHSLTARSFTESQWLRTLLIRLLLELHYRGNASGLGTSGPGSNMGMGFVPESFLGREVTSAKGNDAYLYILLIMIFYACLAGGLILAYTRSRKLLEAKDETSQACPEHQ